MPQENTQKSAQAAMPENKMGTMPVRQLLISMSIPLMISMTVQALYNIVDSIFVSRISESALTAVSLVFPIQTLMIAFAVGTGVGFSSLLSRSLGAKDFKQADRAAENGIFLEMIAFAAFFLVGLFFSRAFIGSQTSDPEIFAHGVEYMSTVCMLSFGIFLQVTFERMLQATGSTMQAMIAQLIGALTNIVLDPIMIFGLLGMPALGVRGAALATVIGQLAGAVAAIWLSHHRNPQIHLDLRHFRPHARTIGLILAVGLPSVVMQAIGSVMTYCMNRILIAFTPTATAVFGIYFKLNSFIFMPCFGLSNGLVPIVAYNYGARRRDRMVEALKYAWIFAIGIMTAGLLLFQLLPQVFLGFFNASDAMLAIGVPALRIISLTFPIAGFSIICSSLYQALGNGMYSMIISLVRQLIVLVPSAYLLARTGVLGRVWWSFIIADVFALAICIFFLTSVFRRVVNKIPSDGQPAAAASEALDD